MDAAGYGSPPAGFRLPAETRLGAVHLQIADLDRSIAFYTRTIGLHLLEQTDGTAEFGIEGADTPLLYLRERTGAVPHPPRGRLGLFHFAILLPDRGALGRILPHLAERRVLNGASDHLVSEALYLQDPDGLGIEIYADRPRSEWRSRGGELAMDTLPLDVESVIQAGAGETWTGMPSGTTIGHVHLHVPALADAESFYGGLIGFDKTVWSYPGALFFGAGGYHHHLGTNTWAGAAAAAPGADDAQLIAWEMILPTRDDVNDLQASLGTAVQPLHREPGLLVVRDPSHAQLRIRAEKV